MTDLFLKLVNMSISASWLVLAVLLLRALLKKAPKWTRPLLWGIVGLRLIFPFSIESSLSLIPSAEPIPPEIITAPNPAIRSTIPLVNEFVNPILSATVTPPPGASVNPLQILVSIAAWVWLAGIAAMLIYTAVSYLRLRRRVSEALPLHDGIYACGQVASPFVLGLVHPRIYLPLSMRDADRTHVIAHEQAHIRRRDHLVKPLGFLLLSLYWFNPLLWLAYILLCRDIELACDEHVIRALGCDARADYSEALLRCSVPRRQIAACPLAFGETGVKERVKNVLNYKKPAFWIILLAILSCIAVAVCFLTTPLKPRESMKWANDLTVEDIERIEMVVFPQTEDKQYKVFPQEELADIIALINASRGKYLQNHEDLTGSSITFYITTKDGKTHTVRNNGYLIIDGDYYTLKHDDASAWYQYDEGNAALPEDFFEPGEQDHSAIYQVESLVYYNTHLSSAPPSPETAPLYALSSDDQLLILEDKKSNNWLRAGTCVKVELSKDILDQLADPNQVWNGTSSDALMKNNAGVWQVIVSPDLPNSVIYYILKQNNGELYLAYACGDPAGNTVPFSDWNAVNWICKLRLFTDFDVEQISLSSISLRIVDGADSGSLVLAGQGAGDVYTLDLNNEEVKYYLDGNPTDASALEDGMVIEISYGALAESYPARFTDVSAIHAYSPGSETNDAGSYYDLCGLYLDVLNDLWEKDAALNKNITYISVDLTRAPGNLTDGEKSAIAWIFAGMHQAEGLTLSKDALLDQGYITPETDDSYPDGFLRWKDGVLLSIYADAGAESAASTLRFEAAKWRSSLGAYLFTECTAKWEKNGRRSGYTIGSEAIS